MSIESDVYNDISDYLRTHYGAEKGVLSVNSRLEDLGLDSLGLLAIAEILERKYHVSLDDEGISAIHTFGDLVDLVKQRSAETTWPSI